MRIYFNDPIDIISAARIVEKYIKQYGAVPTNKDCLFVHDSLKGKMETYVKKVKSGYSVSQWRAD